MGPVLTRIRYGGRLHGMSVVADAPVGRKGDRLLFRRYLDPVVAVLTDEDQETPLTIGIFGPWGSGKSSLLRMLREELVDAHDNEFVCVEFNAQLSSQTFWTSAREFSSFSAATGDPFRYWRLRAEWRRPAV
jgi:predicted alpha/beta-fold hydrolase